MASAISTRSRHFLTVVVVILITTGINVPVRGQELHRLFDLPNDQIAVVLVTTPQCTPPEEPADIDIEAPEMLLRLQGILAIVDGRDYKLLASSEPRVRDSTALPADAIEMCAIHLIGRNSHKRIEIHRTFDGRWFGAFNATDAPDELPRCIDLHSERFNRVALDWPLYLGSFESTNEQRPCGMVFAIEQPYTPGFPFMDEDKLRARTFVAQSGERFGTSRDLAGETLRIRLPANYDPKTPAGLLVWVNAMSNGSPPEVFNKALDELNIICIGADNSGNERPVADRYQLALDAVATASTRFHIDQRRIYVTGISGGGRISSMLWATVPETFTGAIPIVGINYFKAIPTGDGRKWPATYHKPPSRLLAMMKQHRVAAMTGPPDFNYAPTVATIAQMRRDRFNAKLFEYADMAHQMPTPERFLEALEWLDEPFQISRQCEIDEAGALLDEYMTKYGDHPPIDDGARALLQQVISSGPWSEPAWDAVRLLKTSADADVGG